jgi:transcriptional regulator with XRE-family HTH domain
MIENLRQIRKERGLTLRQVEEMTGISNAYLSQLETGKIKKPSHHVIQTLYGAYNKQLPIAGVSSKRPNQFSSQEIIEAIKTQWIKDFKNLRDDSVERDGYFFIGFIHEALKAACASSAVAKGVRDWQEDFAHENGNYQSRCRNCGELFNGHKRRILCKICG